MTRPLEWEGGEDRLVLRLRDVGMRPRHLPLLRLTGPPDPAALGAAVRAFLRSEARARWLVVTSRNALPPLLEAVRSIPGGLDGLAGRAVQIAAVGSETAAALARAGLRADLVPDRFRAEELAAALEAAAAGHESAGEGFGERNAEGVEVLLPRARDGRELLPHRLEEMGARVRVVTAYAVEPDLGTGARLVAEAEEGKLDVVTLTSGSAARVLAESLPGAWPAGVRLAAIGPVTAEAARKAGLPVHLVPERATFAALVEAVRARD